MRTIESKFQAAPWGPKDEVLAVECATNIMDEAGAFEPHHYSIDVNTGVLSELYSNTNGEVEEIVLKSLKTLVELIRKRCDDLLPDARLHEISLESAYLDEGRERLDEVNQWHIDSNDGARVFIAFGDVSCIECVDGNVSISSYDENVSGAEIQEQIDQRTVHSTRVPNNVAVIITNTTVHRKSPQNNKSDLRLTVIARYQ